MNTPSFSNLDSAAYAWINAGPEPSTALLAFATFMSEMAPDIAGVGLGVAAAFGGPDLRRSVVRAVLCMLLAWFTVTPLRKGFPMPRPAVLHQGWQWLAHGGSSSFPSHHGAGAFACWCGLALSPTLQRRRVLVCSGLAVAIGIGWSRIYLGVHFPRDVLAGAGLGCISAILVTAAPGHVQAWWMQRSQQKTARPGGTRGLMGR